MLGRRTKSDILEEQRQATAAVDLARGDIISHTAALASDSYPELTEILAERPPLERMGVADPNPSPNGAAGPMCSLCGIRPVETVAMGSDVCGYCAKNKFGQPSDNSEPAQFGEYTGSLRTASMESVDEAKVRHLATCPSCKTPHALEIPASAVKSFHGDLGAMSTWQPKHWAQEEVAMANGSRDPMARYGMSTSDIKCRNCGTPILKWQQVKGRYSDKIQCSERCMNSKRPDCDCSCVGKNHGKAHVAGLQTAKEAGFFDWLTEHIPGHENNPTPSFDWCFSGDTDFLTYDGYRMFKEVAGTIQLVMDGRGDWVEAEVRSFGVQPLKKITLTKRRGQKVIYTTANHNWVVQGVTKQTDQLVNGDKLDWKLPRKLTHNWQPSPFGIAHGIVFGDGTLTDGKTPAGIRGKSARISLWGEKDAQLLKYFDGCPQTSRGAQINQSAIGIEVNGLPRFFKERPSLDESIPYLYGWLSGYFAADGRVGPNGGNIELTSADRSNLEFVQAVCNRLTIATYDIKTVTRYSCAGRGIIHDYRVNKYGVCTWDTTPTVVYHLALVAETVPEEFFLIAEHASRFQSRRNRDAGRKQSLDDALTWRIESVEDTDRVEEVYCVTVPTTESFVLQSNILTGNCRFRRNQHCFYPRDLDRNASAQAGYAVWIPVDRGPCPRQMWEDQRQCFAGDTEFLTYDGYRTFKEVADTTQKVLTSTGQWVDADVRPFGQQPLMKLTLSRGRVSEPLEIYATGGHRWFVKGRKRSDRTERQDYRLPRTTDTLKAGDRLASVLPFPYIGKWQPSPIGIMHGFVFGDGTRSGNSTNLRGNGCSVTLWGEKDAQLAHYFVGHSRWADDNPNQDRNVSGITFGGLPGFFKDRPSLDECPEYLYGWLAGYFAADGNVSDGIQLDCVNRETLEFVQAVCNRLTIATYGIRSKIRSGCDGKGIIHDSNMRRNGICSLETAREIFSLSFVGKTLRPEFFLIEAHRQKFLDRKDVSPKLAWTVVSVEETDRVEEVFCAVVPVTESFVLVDNILTGNCPISEPGPHSRDPKALTDATRSWDQGGQRGGHSTSEPLTLPAHMTSLDKEGEYLTADYLRELGREALEANPDFLSNTSAMNDPEFNWHFTSSWKDVKEKATQMRKEGHVRIISAPSTSNPYIVAEVMGDTNVYQTTLLRSLGGKSVAGWECGCAWAHYSWGRSGRWAKYEGRMCSHALATLYQAQSDEMFGGKVKEVSRQPLWQDETTKVQQPGDYWDKHEREIGPWRLGSLDTIAKKMTEPQKCKWCDNPATKSYLWAEGMAYIPTCDEHTEKTRSTIEDDNNDEVIKVRDIEPKEAKKKKQPYAGAGIWYGGVHEDEDNDHDNDEATGSDSDSGGDDDDSGGSGGGSSTGSWHPVEDIEEAPVVVEARSRLEAGQNAAEVLEYVASLGAPKPLSVIAQALVSDNVVKDQHGIKHTITEFGDDDLYTDGGIALDPESVVHPNFDPHSGLDLRRDSSSHNPEDGVMIALVPPRYVLNSLSVDGGEQVEQMHITVAYLGKTDGIDEHELHKAVAAFATTAPAMHARIGGFGQFNKGVHVALVDIPGIDQFRRHLMTFLGAAGISVTDEHGLQPHITLAYSDDDMELEDHNSDHEFELEWITVAYGGEWTQYPLQGKHDFAKAAGSLGAFDDSGASGSSRRGTETNYLLDSSNSIREYGQSGLEPVSQVSFGSVGALETTSSREGFGLQTIASGKGFPTAKYEEVSSKQKAELMQTIARAPMKYDPRGMIHDQGITTISPHNKSQGVINPGATHFEDLPQAHQERIRDVVTRNAPVQPGPDAQHAADPMHEHMVQNLMSLHRRTQRDNPEINEAGAQWYRGAHHQIQQWSKQYGVHPEHAAGVVAALSPNTTWESNMSSAHYMMRHMGSKSKEKLDLAPEHLQGEQWEDENGEKHDHVAGKAFRDMHPHEAASALFLKAKKKDDLRDEIGEPAKSTKQMAKTNWSYSPNIQKAARIMGTRSHPAEHPNDVLNGHKVRSFYNNLADPENKHGRDDVTMDTHAISAAAGAKISSTSKTIKKIFDPSNVDAERNHNVHGTYSYFAHAYREAHKRLQATGEIGPEVHPHDFQAQIWGGWKHLMDRKRSGNAPSEFPVAASLHIERFAFKMLDWGTVAKTAAKPPSYPPLNTIDPWFDPNDDEPDPDIFPEENLEWHKEHHGGWGRNKKKSSALLGYDPWIMVTAAIEGDSAQNHTTLDADEDHATGSDPDAEWWNKNREPEVSHNQIPNYMVEAARDYSSPWSQTGLWQDRTAEEGTRRKPKLLKPLPHSKCNCDTCTQIRTDNHGARQMLNWKSNAPAEHGVSAEEEAWNRSQAMPHHDYDDAFAFEGELHDGPEPALPWTDGADENDEDQEEGVPPSNIWEKDHDTTAPNPASAGPPDFGRPLDPNSYHEDMGIKPMDESLLAPGRAPTDPVGGAQDWSHGMDALSSCNWLMAEASDSGNGTPDTAGNSDIAARARLVLEQGEGALRQVEAAKVFAPHEQAELINENEGESARNIGDLQIEGTHYAQLEASLQDEESDTTWLGL